jgi:hypothetical protein
MLTRAKLLVKADEILDAYNAGKIAKDVMESQMLDVSNKINKARR